MKTMLGLNIAVLVPLGLMTLVQLVFGVGESVGGDPAGLMHLVPVPRRFLRL